MHGTKVDKKALKQMQLHPTTKEPFTPEQFYLERQGGVLAISKFQSALGEMVTAAVIKNVVTNEVWELLKSPDFRKEFNEKLENKDSNISFLSRDHFKNYKELFKDKFIGLKEKVDVLDKKMENTDANEKIAEDVKERLLEKLNKDKKKAIADFVDKELYKGNFVKTTQELLDYNDTKKYEEGYKRFVAGFVTYDEKGERTWQFGWDEAQKNIKAKIIALPSEIKTAKAEFENDDVQQAMMKTPAKEWHQALHSMERKNPDMVKRYKERKRGIEKLEQKLANYRDLLEETERYRNGGVALNTMLWKDYNEDHASVTKNSVAYKTIPPKQDQEYPDEKERRGRPPYVALCNRLAGQIGVHVFDNGVKSFESLLRKLGDAAHGQDPSGVFDSFRLTLGVESSKGVNFLISNVVRSAKNSDMKVYSTEQAKVYDSFLMAYSMNVATTIEIEGKKYTRVGEVKIIPLEQMLVKPLNDKIYDTRRLIFDDKGDNKSSLKDFDQTDERYCRKIYDNIKLILEDKNVKSAILKHGIKFNSDMQNFESFNYHAVITQDEKDMIKMNYKDMYDDLTKLERFINIDALKKTDKKLKQIAYSNFMGDCDLRLGELSKVNSPRLREEVKGIEGDKEMLLKAYSSEEAKEFSAKYKATLGHKK